MYKVLFTENQDEVPMIIKKFSPDLVIVDIMQNEVVERLKDYRGGKACPVLLMTGYTKRAKDRYLPVDDIVEKPFNLPLLERKIEQLIKRAS